MTHDEILNGINAIPVEIDSINTYSITIYENGKFYNQCTLQEIRNRVNL